MKSIQYREQRKKVNLNKFEMTSSTHKIGARKVAAIDNSLALVSGSAV